MTTTLQRFSLDKKAPGLFKEASGGWCKYADALAAIEAAVRAEREACAAIASEKDYWPDKPIAAGIRARKTLPNPLA
jgi:hypothetical protein